MLRKLFFNFMYFKKPPWDTGIVPPELIRFTSNHPPGRALDLGCGTGTNAIYLAKIGWNVVAVDFSSRAIAIAKRKARAEQVNVKWLVNDVSRLHNISEVFDLILDIGCFHGLNQAQKEQYLANIKSFLSQNGTFLLYGFLHSPGQTMGITQADLESIRESFVITQQEQGIDHSHTSVWLTINRKPEELINL